MRPKKTLRLVLPVFSFVAVIVITHLTLSANPSAILVPLVVISLLLCTLIPALMYQWNIRPVKTIERALRERNADLLTVLRASSRFGSLAELVATSFEQQNLLKAEIEERKNAQVQLARQQHMYQDLFESVPDAIIIIDTDGTIFLTNKATRLLLTPPTAAQTPIKRLEDLFPENSPVDITACIEASLTTTQAYYEKVCQVQKYSGETFDALLRFVPFTIADKERQYLVYLIDISDEQNAKREKERLQEQFEVVYKMEAIGQLAGGIAHEYNNILGAISGYADLINQRYKSDERLTKYAGMILSASRRASELTRKLLIFARKNRLNLADFNLRDAIEEAIDLLKHTVDKTITITHNRPDSHMYIYGDVTQFQNAIMNLALNSRDAMPEGGSITIESRVTEIDRDFTHRRDFSVAPGRYVAIAISDNGCGMDREVLSHLFEPFYTTKDIGQGTGLGLASVYGTIKSHHGCIDVTSEPDKGTTFTLYFPLVEKAPLDVLGTHHADTPVHGSILFIDDESILRDAVREMLTLIGYSVTTGIDGENALSLFASGPDRFDLIILDMKMPGMSGIECYRKMKELQPEVRVLLSTGYSIEEDRQSLMNEGFIGIIQKPYVSSQLARAVRAALPEQR